MLLKDALTQSAAEPRAAEADATTASASTAWAEVMNGHGRPTLGIVPVGGTFFVFSDYIRAARYGSPPSPRCT